MKTLKLLLVLLLAAQWAPAQAQQTDTKPSDSSAHAQLEKGKSSFRETWVNPDADFTQYTKLYVWDGQFEYRDVGPARRSRGTMVRTHKREFGISDADRAKFEKAISDAFMKQIEKGKRFQLVAEIGPNTLILRGGLLDIVSNVPPEMTGPSEIYLSSVGEATLVMELLDAETGEVVALVAERRRIQPMGGQIGSTPTNSVTVLADVRRFASSAASRLSKELDKAIAGR